jgi:integrase
MGARMPEPQKDNRTGVYEYRKTVPADLRPFIGKSNIIKSLGTKDLAAAKPRFAKIAAEVEEQFANLRKGIVSLTKREAAFHAGEIYRLIVEPYLDNPSLSPDIKNPLLTDRLILNDPEIRIAYISKSLNKEEFVKRLKRHRNSKWINQYLLGKGLRLDETSMDLLTTQVAKAAYQGKKHLQRLAGGDWRDDPEAGRFPQLPARPQPVPKVAEAAIICTPTESDPLLSTARAKWIKEKDKADGSGWSETSANQYKLWSERFIEICDDRPVSTYKKSDAAKFKDALLVIPPNYKNKKGYADLTFAKVVEKAEKEGPKPIAAGNINKILGHLKSLFNHVIGHQDSLEINPFAKLSVREKNKARLQRTPFSTDALTAIFKAPLFKGCQSSMAWLTPGDHIPNDEGIFWVPLIGLFTGARSGEIIQLLTSDVRKEGGILYYDIRYDPESDDEDEEAKHLKTDAAYRAIPVHPFLLELGFEEFVEYKRKKDNRLFPEFRADKFGYFSTRYSPRFRRFLESLDIKRKRNSFHSFRHCFEDACNNSKIPLKLINSLQGHAGEGMEARYGNGLIKLRVLTEEIKRLEYIDLDLSHLRTSRFISKV